ncbi:MAG: hypothetical protein AAB409_01825 [Gemmatimonadota bacterium]
MADRKAFPLRMDPETYAALQRWAADDLRSLNAQIEFVLRRALVGEGRLWSPATPGVDPPVKENDASAGTKES